MQSNANLTCDPESTRGRSWPRDGFPFFSKTNSRRKERLRPAEKAAWRAPITIGFYVRIQLGIADKDQWCRKSRRAPASRFFRRTRPMVAPIEPHRTAAGWLPHWPRAVPRTFPIRGAASAARRNARFSYGTGAAARRVPEAGRGARARISA